MQLDFISTIWVRLSQIIKSIKHYNWGITNSNSDKEENLFRRTNRSFKHSVQKIQNTRVWFTASEWFRLARQGTNGRKRQERAAAAAGTRTSARAAAVAAPGSPASSGNSRDAHERASSNSHRARASQRDRGKENKSNRGQTYLWCSRPWRHWLTAEVLPLVGGRGWSLGYIACWSKFLDFYCCHMLYLFIYV